MDLGSKFKLLTLWLTSVVLVVDLMTFAVVGGEDFELQDYDNDKTDPKSGIPVYDLDDWGKNYWPPYKNGKDGDPKDLPYTEDDAGQKDWQKDLDDKHNNWKKDFGDEKTRPLTSRVYPFCVDGKTREEDKNNKKIDDQDVTRFQPIFATVGSWEALPEGPDNDQLIFAAVSQDKSGASPLGLISQIKFLSIHSPKQKENGIGRLNQWAHMVIKAEDDLVGLYIQANGGPLGVPIGEFRTDFDCKDVPGSTTGLDPYHGMPLNERKANLVIPCKYSPHTAVRPPTVFVYGGSPEHADWTPRKEFRLHFNWDDVACNYVARVQFLIIAVKNFTNYKQGEGFEVFFSPGYEQQLDSGDGFAYPYYSAWKDKMECVDDIKHDTKSAHNFYFHPNRSMYAMYFNDEYDECVVTGLRPSLKDPPKLVTARHCPPGPLDCNIFHETHQARTVAEYNKGIDDYNEIVPPLDCRPKTPPEDKVRHCRDPKLREPILIRDGRKVATKKPDEPPDLDDRKLIVKPILENAYKKVIRASRGTHGHMMVLAWMMLTAIGTFWARFYKETHGLAGNNQRGCLGIGYWLWGHMIIIYLAIAAMWLGIVEVLHVRADGGNPPCDKYPSNELIESCMTKNFIMEIHKWIGIVSVVLFHGAFFTGWIRPFRNFSRRIFVFSHVIMGYLGKLFCILSVLILLGTSTVCIDVVVETILLEVVSLLCFAGGFVIQFMEDKLIQSGKRKIFPVPEAIEVPTEKSRYTLFKIILLLISWVIHSILYALVVISYIKIYTGDSVIEAPFEVLSGIIDPSCKVIADGVVIEAILKNMS